MVFASRRTCLRPRETWIKSPEFTSKINCTLSILPEHEALTSLDHSLILSFDDCLRSGNDLLFSPIPLCFCVGPTTLEMGLNSLKMTRLFRIKVDICKLIFAYSATNPLRLMPPAYPCRIVAFSLYFGETQPAGCLRNHVRPMTLARGYHHSTDQPLARVPTSSRSHLPLFPSTFIRLC